LATGWTTKDLGLIPVRILTQDCSLHDIQSVQWWSYTSIPLYFFSGIGNYKTVIRAVGRGKPIQAFFVTSGCE
jgi:hypothetical protein